jgi:hypothetical protein
LSPPCSRRAALRVAAVGGLSLVTLPAFAGGLSSRQIESASAQAADFVPENDYPYFGYEPGRQDGAEVTRAFAGG